MRLALVVGLIVMWPWDPAGYSSAPETAQEPYLMLAAKSTSTMQSELDEAVSRGYRVRLVAPTSGHEVVVLMEAAAGERLSYMLLATQRTGTMERELNATAAAGYRLVRGSAVAKALAASAFFPGGREEEILVLMERDPSRAERFEYRLLATTLTGTLSREIQEAQADGFELADLVSRDEHIVIMERPAS